MKFLVCCINFVGNVDPLITTFSASCIFADMHHSPAFREALMLHYRDWITPSQKGEGGFTCWDKDLESVVDICPNTGQMMLTVEFERETQDKDAWTISDKVLSTFPDAPAFGLSIRDGSFDSSIAKRKRGGASHTTGVYGWS